MPSRTWFSKRSKQRARPPVVTPPPEKATVASVQAAANLIQAGLLAIDARLLPTESVVADFNDPTRLPVVEELRLTDVVVVYQDGVRMRTTLADIKALVVG